MNEYQQAVPLKADPLAPDVEMHFFPVDALYRRRNIIGLCVAPVLIGWFVYGILNMDRFAYGDADTILVVCILVLAVVFGVIMYFYVSDYTRFARAIVQRICPDAHEETREALASAALGGLNGFLRRLLIHLADSQRSSIVGIVSRSGWIKSVRSVDVPFEPLVLDEHEPAFENLESTELDSDADVVEYFSEAAVRKRRGRANRIKLGLPALWAINVGIPVFVFTREGALGFGIFFLIVVSAGLIIGMMVRKGSLSRRQWLIVPGGVVVRTPEAREANVLFACSRPRRAPFSFTPRARRK